MSTTPNLLAGHIASNQATKEVTANAAFDILDLALTNELVKAMADADLTLVDPTEARQNMVFTFTGALTADRHIVVPNSEKLYIVSNQTTGGHNLIFETVSDFVSPFVFGTTVSVPSTNSPYLVIYCDALNVVQVGYLIGTTANTVAAGNDSRITGAEQTANKDVASGYAGLTAGGLLKTAEFPTITSSFVDTSIEITAHKNAVSGYAGLDSNTKLTRAQLLQHYTVSGLPVGAEGDLAYATNGRKVGEGAGLGTGVPVYYTTDGGSPALTGWYVFSTDALVQS